MSGRLPPMESLRVFEVSARHANFTRAAKELGVTPTAVSLRIRDLEVELGQALFLRNGPRIVLTDAGEKLATRMVEVMAIARAAVTDCRTEGGSLEISATPTFGRWLASRLPHYDAVEDACRIQLEVTPEVRPSGRFHVAIRSGRGDWPGMRAIPLLPVLSTPMLSPALARQFALQVPADLQRLPLLADSNWLPWFQSAGIAHPELMLTRTAMLTQDMLASAAIAGAGVALLSPVLFKSLVIEKKLVQPFKHILAGPESYYAVHHVQDRRAETGHFVQWLCAEIASEWSGKQV